MIIETWLRKNTAKLNNSEVPTARLDCLVLLEDITGKERGWLLAHPEFELEESLVKKLGSDVKRRAEHEPLAYIRNKTEFYGREFYIDHRVLEPRPESETMIELLKASFLRHSSVGWNLVKKGIPINQLDPSLRWDDNEKALTIVDVGTGSGALAITVKLEFPAATVIATDIDPGCLAVAERNASNLNADIQFFVGDLLEPTITNKYASQVILANLPYVPDDYHINAAAMKEPKLAIFGGKDGLDMYRRMFDQLRSLEQQPQFILTESMPPQHEALADIAHSAGYKLVGTDDFIQVFTLMSSRP